MSIDLKKDPFRLYFPFAIFLALYASGLWVFFSFLEIGDFPVIQHARAFSGGFLFLSVIGFLLTAIPRFTESDFLTENELRFSYLLIFLVVFSTFFFSDQLFWPSVFIGWPFMFNFARKRFIKRKQNPPFTFFFVGLGILLGFTGSLFLSLSSYVVGLPFDLERIGKILFFDGMIMSLVLGIGGRLIPGILGFTEIVQAQRKIYEKPLPFLKVVPMDILVSAALFILSLLLESADHIRGSFLLRTIVITYIAIGYWRIHEKVKTGKWHGRMLKLSCSAILLSVWLGLIFPEEILSIKHLYYIGGYALLTLLIASRVILSHGSVDLDFEKKKYPYVFIGLMLFMAALTRASANFIPNSYLEHLGYAAILFIIVLVSWSVAFMPKIFKISQK